MTAFISVVIVLTLLACIPLVFLFAGKDTDHHNALRHECQREALLDWTDKEILPLSTTILSALPASLPPLSPLSASKPSPVPLTRSLPPPPPEPYNPES